LDSIVKIQDLVLYLKDNGFQGCAITDHGWMAGCLKFYQTMKKEGLKSLLGVECYVTHQPDNTEKSLYEKDNYHLVLIAKNIKGYQGLMKLVSEAALNNFYYKPRVYFKKLESIAEDCFALSACMAGELFKKGFKEGHLEEIFSQYKSVFSSNFLGEIQDWPNPEQQEYNKALVKLCRETGTKVVITSDVHYLKKEDYDLHEIIMAMQLKKTVQQYREEGKMIYGEDFYVRSADEMLYSCRAFDTEEAIENTNWVASQCNVELSVGKFFPPRYKESHAL
jgi:DNA polymerase-3 subunit alpha